MSHVRSSRRRRRARQERERKRIERSITEIATTIAGKSETNNKHLWPHQIQSLPSGHCFSWFEWMSDE